MKQLIGAFANPKNGKQNVILVEKELTDDGDILKTFKVIEDPSFSFWKSKEPKDVYETSVPIEEVDIVTTKYSQLFKTLAEITNRKKFYNKCMEGNRRDLNNLHFNKDIHLSDIHILDYLFYDFYQKNKKDPKDTRSMGLHKAFFDIEVDGIDYDAFPEPDLAPCPINFISYIEDGSKVMKAYILFNLENNQSQKEFYEANRGDCTNYWTSDNNEWCKKALDELFTDNVNPKNSASKVVLYWHKNEVSLISKFYSGVHKDKADFLGGK